MKTTTVRFDVETWEDIERQSARLGVAHAEFIRGAVHRRLGRLAEADRIAAVELHVDALDAGLARVVQMVSRISRAIGSSRR